MDDQEVSFKDHDSLHAEHGSIKSSYRSSSQSQAGSEEGQHDADTRSQCSQRSGDTRSQCSHRSDLGYHSGGGAYSDVEKAAAHPPHHHPYESSSGGGGGYHPLSSMRSVGSSGSQEDRGVVYHPPLHSRAAHLMSGETQFPPSMYHARPDAPKSDVATVCSGSVVEDIEDESLLSCDMSSQQATTGSSSKPGSPPSSVKMAVGTLRRTNSAGNRLVDFADRSQELLSSVIPQERAIGHHYHARTPSEGMPHHDAADVGQHLHEMGPPLSRSLLLHGGSASRPGSVKSLASNAGSDLGSHVDTDELGGSLRSVSDAHSVLSQEDAPMTAAAAPAAGEDVKMPAVDLKMPPVASKSPAASTTDMDTTSTGEDESSASKPHPLLLQSDPQNGRTSPGGTIYRGRGVRRYQGRFMHLPLKRFHQNGVHLRSVDEQQQQPGVGSGQQQQPGVGSGQQQQPGVGSRQQQQPGVGSGGEAYVDPYSELHDGYDGDNWQDRYNDESWERGRSSPRSSFRRRNHFDRLRSRSRSRSRSQEKEPSKPPEKEMYDNRRDSSSGGYDPDRRSGGGGRNSYRGRGRNGGYNNNKNRNGYNNATATAGRYPNRDTRDRAGNYNNRSRNNYPGGRGGGNRYQIDDSPSNSRNNNFIRNKNRRK